MKLSMGRTPLGQKEYWAYKQMIGMLNTLIQNESAIEGRSRLVTNGWRDLKMCQAVLMKLHKNIWHTIPWEQQKRLEKELKNTKTYIDVNRPQDNGERDGFVYMPAKSMCRLADMVMRQECLFCDKCGKKVNRCQIRKDLEATYEWYIERLPDGSCPFAGLVETGKA